VAAANAYDSLVSVADGPHADRRTAIEELGAAAGTRYGQEVIDALSAVVGVKPRRSSGRRRNDAVEAGERGAA
jgi:hypothetical protein